MPTTLFQTRQLSDNLVLNTKLSDMVSQTIKGRVTAGTGDPEDLTATQVRTILGLSTTDVVQFGNLNSKVFNIAVPTTINDGIDICTVTNASYSSCIEIDFTVADGSFAVSKTYKFAASFNDTGGAWRKLVPLSSTGAYSSNDCELDINTNASTSTIRFRRTSGSTAGTGRIVVTVSGYPSGTTIATSSATYTGITGLTDYNQTSLTMLGGNVGIGIAVPTAKLHVIGGITSGNGSSPTIGPINCTNLIQTYTSTNEMVLTGGAGNMAYVTSGSAGTQLFGSGRIGFGDAHYISFHSNNDGRGSGDVRISRNTTAIIQVGTTSNNAAGSIMATNHYLSTVTEGIKSTTSAGSIAGIGFWSGSFLRSAMYQSNWQFVSNQVIGFTASTDVTQALTTTISQQSSGVLQVGTTGNNALGLVACAGATFAGVSVPTLIIKSSASGSSSAGLISFQDSTGAQQGYVYREGTSQRFCLTNSTTGANLCLGTNNADRLTIFANGNVSIHTGVTASDNGSRLQVNGTLSVTDYIKDSSGANRFRFDSPGAGATRIVSSGTVFLERFANDGTVSLGTSADYSLILVTNNVTRATISNTGTTLAGTLTLANGMIFDTSGTSRLFSSSTFLMQSNSTGIQFNVKNAIGASALGPIFQVDTGSNTLVAGTKLMHVLGNTGGVLVYTALASGENGFGTATPTEKVDVVGNIKVSGRLDGPSTMIIRCAGTGGASGQWQFQDTTGNVRATIDCISGQFQSVAGIGAGTTSRQAINGTVGLDLIRGDVLRWRASTFGSVETIVASYGAGAVEINNGTQGTYRDLTLRNLISSSGTIKIATSGSGAVLRSNTTDILEVRNNTNTAMGDFYCGRAVVNYLDIEHHSFTLVDSSPDEVATINIDNGILTVDQTTFGLRTISYEGHTHTLSDLTQSGATTNQVPQWDGSDWVPATISSGSGLTWTITTTDGALAPDNGYIANKGTLLTMSLPTTCATGKIIKVAGMNAGLWKISQAAGQSIKFGNQSTTTGTGGYLSSVLTYDTVELLCIVADTTWMVVSSVGNLDIN